MKRVAAGDHLPTPWLFEHAKRTDDGADYCLGNTDTGEKELLEREKSENRWYARSFSHMSIGWNKKKQNGEISADQLCI